MLLRKGQFVNSGEIKSSFFIIQIKSIKLIYNPSKFGANKITYDNVYDDNRIKIDWSQNLLLKTLELANLESDYD